MAINKGYVEFNGNKQIYNFDSLDALIEVFKNLDGDLDHTGSISFQHDIENKDSTISGSIVFGRIKKDSLINLISSMKDKDIVLTHVD